MQMKIKTRIPIGVVGIANIMGMSADDVRMWPYLENMRELLKDYNYGVLQKADLIEKLNEISAQCIESKIDNYSVGIQNAITSIKMFY